MRKKGCSLPQAQFSELQNAIENVVIELRVAKDSHDRRQLLNRLLQLIVEADAILREQPLTKSHYERGRIPYTLYKKELPKTSEMTEKSYQAVRCSYCSEPNPLSTRLLEIFVVESDSPSEPQCQAQVFILRCEACSKESCYLKAEIDTFEFQSPQTGELDRFGALRSPASYGKAPNLHR